MALLYILKMPTLKSGMGALRLAAIPKPRAARVSRGEAAPVAPAPHGLFPAAVGAADDDRELGHVGVGHGVDELGPVLGDAAVLVLLAGDEPGGVLEGEEGDFAHRAERDEVGPLERALGEEDPVVGQDAHGVAHDPSKAADEGLGVELL